MAGQLPDFPRVPVDPSYVLGPIPSPLDDDLWSFLSAALETGRLRELEDALTLEQAHLLSAFAERMATLAVRTKSQDVLRLGVLAVYLSLTVSTERDLLLIPPLLFDAADRLAVPRESLMEFVASSAAGSFDPDAGVASVIHARHDIASMGYVLRDDGDGPTYLRTW
jgi:hypothetical protein